MAQLDVQKIAVSGTAITFSPVGATGDKFKNNGRTLIRINNGGEAETSVSISRKTCSLGFSHPVTETVEAGESKDFGPFSPELFNDEDGNVTVTCDPVADVTIAAVSL